MEDKGNPGDDSLRRELGRRILECCERDTEMLKINLLIAETVSRYIDEVLKQIGCPSRTTSNCRMINELERNLESLNELKNMIRLTIDDKEDLT